MFPDRKVEMIIMPGETKAGKGPSESGGSGGAPAAPGVALDQVVECNPEHVGSATSAPALSEKPEDAFPRMPSCKKPRLQHRTKITAPHQLPKFSAAVARPVCKDIC